MNEEERDEQRRAAARRFLRELAGEVMGAGSTLRATYSGRQQLTFFSLTEEEAGRLRKVVRKYNGNGITIEVRYLSVMCDVLIE